MPKVTFETVRKAALSLTGVEEGTAYGFPAFRAAGKLFLVFRRDLDAIVVRASFDERDAMIEADPETYFTTDHHRPYPWVLARVAKLRADAVADLVNMSRRHVPARRARKPRK